MAVPTITTLNNAATDLAKIAEFMESAEPTMTTRLGAVVPTRFGLTAVAQASVVPGGAWNEIRGISPDFTMDMGRGEYIGYTQTAGSVDAIKDVSGLGQTATASGTKAPLASSAGRAAIQFNGTAAHYGPVTLTLTHLTGDNKPIGMVWDFKVPTAPSATHTLWTMYSNATPANFVRCDLSSNNISVLLASGVGLSKTIGSAADYGQSLGQVGIAAMFVRPGTNLDSVFWNCGEVVARGDAGITGTTAYNVDRLAIGGLVAGTQKSRAIQSALDIKHDTSLTAVKVAEVQRRLIRKVSPDLEMKAIAIVALGQSNAHGHVTSGSYLETFPAGEAYYKGLLATGTDVFDRTVSSANFSNRAYVALYFAARLKARTAAMGINGGKGLIPIFFDNVAGGTPWLAVNATAGGLYLEPEVASPPAGATSNWTLRQDALGQFKTLNTLSANLDIIDTVGVLSAFEADTQISAGPGSIKTPASVIQASMQRYMSISTGAPIAAVKRVLMTELSTRGITQSAVEGQEPSIAVANGAMSTLEALYPEQFMKVFTHNGRYGVDSGGPFSLTNLQVNPDGSYISGTYMNADGLHREPIMQKAIGYTAADTFIAKGGLAGLI